MLSNPASVGRVHLFEMLYPKDPAVDVSRSEDSIALSWRRHPAEGLFLLGIACCCLITTVVSSTQPDQYGQPRPIGAIVFFCILFGGGGLFLAYLGLGVLCNRWTVTADRSHVEVHWGPVHLGRSKSFMAEGIKQFFAARPSPASSSRSSSTDALYLIDKDDHVRAVTHWLPTAFAAYQVVHELQDFYGLEDLPVYGVTTDPVHPGPRA